MDTANPASSAARDPEPSYGPDEEGEVPLTPDAVPSEEDKPGAWVKTDDSDDHPEVTAARSGGGQAVGGIAAQPGDPTSPALARARASERDGDMAGEFGDHKGGRLDPAD